MDAVEGRLVIWLTSGGHIFIVVSLVKPKLNIAMDGILLINEYTMVHDDKDAFPYLIIDELYNQEELNLLMNDFDKLNLKILVIEPFLPRMKKERY